MINETLLDLELPHVGELMLASFPPYKFNFFGDDKWYAFIKFKKKKK